jgi:hypothetical protein
MPSVDAPPAAPVRIATGRHLIDHAAVVGGITSDGYVVFSDVNADGHSVAKVMPIDGGPETVIATSSGTGKSDLRFEIRGGVVFAWADRGNRVATLSVWSQATGVVPRGMNTRPGRAAATADGRMVMYERDVTDTTVNLVAGPVGGPDMVIASANSEDSDCWRNTDIASIGTVTPRLLARYCPAGATAFTLRSLSSDGAMHDLSTTAEVAAYGTTRTIWRETGGALQATEDGLTAEPLATNATDFVVSRDLATLAYLTSDGAIYGLPTDRSVAQHMLVAAPNAKQLGALSPDGQTVLYASKTEDRGKDNLAPYTDVCASAPQGAPQVLIPGTTSCPSCLFDSFTPDGRYALALDPIDNSQAADGSGTIKVFSLADGQAVTSFGTNIYTAIAMGSSGSSGTESRFLFIDAVRDATLSTGWVYGMTARALSADAPATDVARGAENFALDRAHARGVVSFNGTDEVAGLWVISLQ